MTPAEILIEAERRCRGVKDDECDCTDGCREGAAVIRDAINAALERAAVMVERDAASTKRGLAQRIRAMKEGGR